MSKDLDQQNLNLQISPTRRQLMLGIAGGIAGLAGVGKVFAQIIEAPPSQANMGRTTIHQELLFDGSAHEIYDILLQAKKFAAMTGMAAKIQPAEGGAFSTFGGLVSGRNIELIRDERIVQAWRPKSWDPGIYSIVRFELKPQVSGTLLVLDHTGFPEGKFDGLDSGWHERYWDLMKKYLAQ